MAMAAATTATASAPSSFKFNSLSEANSYRLKAIVERLTYIMNPNPTGGSGGSFRFENTEFINLCVALARGVDYALSINDAPTITHRLPSLVKQAYQHKDAGALQPAIMLLMISVKNACKNGWFPTADADELLKIANKLFDKFCVERNVTPRMGNALDIISLLISRFYPHYKMGSLIDSFEVKPGYEMLMSDFQIARNIPAEEKIMLIVVQIDNLETSSCIISPPQASFLVNGKGVDSRTNVSLDAGPQFPTDISKMLKFGSNIFQAVGYFSGTYLIALAFMKKLNLTDTQNLKDHVPPVAAVVGADSEIIVGASKITLNCPISFRRIKTPVKGHLCKHHQCFDYDNYISMNARKPAWRCPCCNQAVSLIDLRIDQHMVKILKEVGHDVAEVVISADGSWKAVVQINSESLSGQQDCNVGSGSTVLENTVTVDVDLTTGEDGQTDSICQSKNLASETTDIKPLKSIYSHQFHQFLAEKLGNNAFMTASASPLRNLVWPNILDASAASTGASTHTAQASGSVGTPQVVLPSPLILDTSAVLTGSSTHTTQAPGSVGISQVVLPSTSLIPVIMNADFTVHSTEPLAIVESSQPNLSSQQLSQARPDIENMQLQLQSGNSMISHEPERPAVPRYIYRNPTAVQALPVPGPQPTYSPYKRMRVNGPNPISLSPNDSSSATHQMDHLALATTAGNSAPNCSTELQQALRTSVTQRPDAVSLPGPIPLNTRVPPGLQRGVGAYRSTFHSSSDTRVSLPPVSLQPVSNNQGLSGNRSNLRSLIMAGPYRSNSVLPLEAARARHVALQKQAGAVTPQPSRIAVSSAVTTESVKVSAPNPEPPLDKNWRPTGRMRGSLTGSAYSAALNHYVVPTTQGRPSVSTQIPSSSNVSNAPQPVTEQSALKPNDSGPGGSNT